MVPKALQGLLWVGKPQYDKHESLFQWYQKHCKGCFGLGKLNMTNIKGFPNGTKSIARAIVGWECST
jgi:hypothetical protein